MRLPRILVLGLCLGLAPRAAQAYDSLNVGDPAPELKVARWVKGNRVAKFNLGRIYVVEFWATWCGPCRESIPHLTELDRQKTANINQRAVPLFKAKKYREFLKSLDKITAGNEAVAKQFAGLKFAAICHSGDIDAGLALAAKFLDEHNDEAKVLTTVFRPLIDPQNTETPTRA